MDRSETGSFKAWGASCEIHSWQIGRHEAEAAHMLMTQVERTVVQELQALVESLGRIYCVAQTAKIAWAIPFRLRCGFDLESSFVVLPRVILMISIFAQETHNAEVRHARMRGVWHLQQWLSVHELVRKFGIVERHPQELGRHLEIAVDANRTGPRGHAGEVEKALVQSGCGRFCKGLSTVVGRCCQTIAHASMSVARAVCALAFPGAIAEMLRRVRPSSPAVPHEISRKLLAEGAAEHREVANQLALLSCVACIFKSFQADVKHAIPQMVRIWESAAGFC